MRVGLGVVVITFAAACGSFGEADTSGPEAPIDAGSSDGGSASDGTTATDGGGGSDSGDVFAAVCAKAIFCDQFNAGLTQWTNVSGEFQLLSEPANGPFVRGSFPRTNDTNFIRHDLPGVSAGLHFSVALRVHDPGYSSELDNANYAVAGLEGTAYGYLVVLYLNRGSADGFATAEVSGASTQDPFKGGASDQQLEYETWHRVDIVVHLGIDGSFGWALDGKSGGGDMLRSDVAGVSAVLGSKRPNSMPPPVQVDFDDVFVEKL